MARIVHIALKVEDLEGATKFYEDVFGLRQTGTGYARGHVSRHMTDGELDIALMTYDNEDVHEAQLSGAGPCIHHWGIEVEDRDATVKLIEANGGTIISERGQGALKYRAPDGTIAEIVAAGRYKKPGKAGPSRIVQLAIKVTDLEAATAFYENVFGFKQVVTKRNHQHISRHLTDGKFDLLLLVYDSESAEEAQLAGPGPRLHHWGIEVGDRDGFESEIACHGGKILSKSQGPTIRFRAPDGILAEVVKEGSFDTLKQNA